MSKFRTALFGASIAAAAVLGAAAHAQDSTSARFVPLSNLVKTVSVNRAIKQDPSAVNPLTYISLHGGLMVAPRGAGLVGADFSISSLSLGNGWHGRIDADAILNADFGGIDTIVPVTFDQVYYSPTAAGGHNVYYGGGIGAVLGGHTVFDAKLILGTELTNKIGGEFNVHFTETETLVCLFARFHL